MSNRKRARYTASFASGAKEVCLGHSPADVAAYYSRRGRAPVSVVKGDYRKQPQRPTGARPNLAEIRKVAAEVFGLTLPLTVTVQNHQGGRRGAYGPKPTRPDGRVAKYVYELTPGTTFVHSIKVKSWVDAEQMGKTLWHELAHAHQFERDILSRTSDARAALELFKNSYRDGTRYARKPWEVEARSYEQHNAERPLAVGR